MKREGALLLLGVIALAVIIWLLVFPSSEEDLIHQLVMFFALYGYLFLAMATLTTPFLKEIARAFGDTFLKVHHAFSILGIVFITLHPVFNAIDRLSLSVFVPRFDSWERFWMFAGRPAFIILYIALFAAVLRTKTPKYWRPFHALMYVVLLFGIVHANLLGDSFENLGIAVIFDALFVASIAGFVLKRYRNRQLRERLLGRKGTPPNATKR
jgi:sulfoxide reductase heme-binding subunit YedZ